MVAAVAAVVGARAGAEDIAVKAEDIAAAAAAVVIVVVVVLLLKEDDDDDDNINSYCQYILCN